MTLENRIKRLEGSVGGQAMQEPALDTDELIRKMGFDPVIIRATAQANETTLAVVIAGELGMSYGDFQKALKQRARGE